MIALLKTSLRNRQHHLIEQLANSIEEQWQNSLDLTTYNIPQDLGYVEGNFESEKLIIENCCYQTPQFRKIHLELAKVGDRLDILHCVMFPRSNYDLPIFGLDLVGSEAGIGAAIVDLSPVNKNRVHTPDYLSAIVKLPQLRFAHPRKLPEWGDIFSPLCLFVQPSNKDEEQMFLERAKQYLTVHCQAALDSTPVSSELKQAEIIAGQRFYCAQQQQNDKTRRVLEKYLGQAWTDRYMSEMLFDCP